MRFVCNDYKQEILTLYIHTNFLVQGKQKPISESKTSFDHIRAITAMRSTRIIMGKSFYQAHR